MAWSLGYRKVVYAGVAVALLTFSQGSVSLLAQAQEPQLDPAYWDLDLAHHDSLTVEPVREEALSRDGLRLALKHFPRPGAQPVVLIHGLAQNDRGWDSTVRRYSFARFLHAQGFDVFVGNLRASGTQGFRSETPPGPHHWTIDDYAISDVPALIDQVQRSTGLAPFVIGHSLAAWALEGYLAGLSYDREGRVVRHDELGLLRQSQIRGIVTLAGVYNLRWQHPVAEARSHPLRNATDYYHSNYELELLTRVTPLYRAIPLLPALPLDWISSILNLPLSRIPYVGSKLEELYRDFQSEVIETPILSMFYYPEDSDPEVVRLHAQDGLEDLGPHVIEQLANAITEQRTSSYYHVTRPDTTYDYGSIRQKVDLPLLFVGGGRDRLASDLEIYEDGFLKTEATDKQYLHVEGFGHLDICSGIHAPAEVMLPVANWIHARS